MAIGLGSAGGWHVPGKQSLLGWTPSLLVVVFDRHQSIVRLAHGDMALTCVVGVNTLIRLEDWVRRNAHLGVLLAFLATVNSVPVVLRFAFQFYFSAAPLLFLRSMVVLLLPD